MLILYIFNTLQIYKILFFLTNCRTKNHHSITSFLAKSLDFAKNDVILQCNGQYFYSNEISRSITGTRRFEQKNRPTQIPPRKQRHRAGRFGNINYDSSFYENSRGNIFVKLKNVEKEIRSISSILSTRNISAKIFEQQSATEESFKNLSGNSPDILHLATHGFCLETEEKAADKPFAQNVNSYSQKESAMVLSGLALSGANDVWKGNFDLPNVEDGVLTAYEISQLDLSNTKLAVLSACETARGRIFPVDGVFGLQRAFKQAGAGSILMSLWKVDDNATATFMEYFYKFLFETNDRHKALKLAQDEVKKKYPDPYYWAAWVMLD